MIPYSPFRPSRRGRLVLLCAALAATSAACSIRVGPLDDGSDWGASSGPSPVGGYGSSSTAGTTTPPDTDTSCNDAIDIGKELFVQAPTLALSDADERDL